MPQDNPLTTWPQKNLSAKNHAEIGDGGGGGCGEKTRYESGGSGGGGEEADAAKENKLDLLSDYLKKIQAGEATVEELATKYDNRIKIQENKDAKENGIHGGGKGDGQIDQLGRMLSL